MFNKHGIRRQTQYWRVEPGCRLELSPVQRWAGRFLRQVTVRICPTLYAITERVRGRLADDIHRPAGVQRRYLRGRCRRVKVAGGGFDAYPTAIPRHWKRRACQLLVGPGTRLFLTGRIGGKNLLAVRSLHFRRNRVLAQPITSHTGGTLICFSRGNSPTKRRHDRKRVPPTTIAGLNDSHYTSNNGATYSAHTSSPSPSGPAKSKSRKYAKAAFSRA